MRLHACNTDCNDSCMCIHFCGLFRCYIPRARGHGRRESWAWESLKLQLLWLAVSSRTEASMTRRLQLAVSSGGGGCVTRRFAMSSKGSVTRWLAVSSGGETDDDGWWECDSVLCQEWWKRSWSELVAGREPQEREESCSFDPEHLQLPQKHVGGSWMS